MTKVKYLWATWPLVQKISPRLGFSLIRAQTIAFSFLKHLSVKVTNLLGGCLPFVCWVRILKLDLLVLVPIYYVKKIQ
jgi:hypothetical protein